MNPLKEFPATLALLFVNCVVFGVTYLVAGTLENPQWTFTLLKIGAQFNPLTLDKEFYRIFTHMFLHGDIVHLVVNMFALYSIGSQLEPIIGTRKFSCVYFLSGIGSSLISLYWNLFVIGVGASGAIFGVFGFMLVVSLALSRRLGQSVTPILTSFGVFLVINIVFGEMFHADHSAHLGGFFTGALLGFGTQLLSLDFSKIKIEYFLAVVFLGTFLLLPRYQVDYFKFFQQVLKAEQGVKDEARAKLSDDELAELFEKNNGQWDSARVMLSSQSYVPERLRSDTFKLGRYISLRIMENDYKVKMIRQEIFILLDSMEIVQDSIRQFLILDYPLSYSEHEDGVEKSEDLTSVGGATKVWYDSNWVEIPTPGKYYRIGFRDSLQRWQGPVRDYYANGDIQMKGSYKNDLRHGIFIYYTEHQTYSSAGRYFENRSIGKWQSFYDNGKLKSEVVYRDWPFMKNLWDSAGRKMVEDGNGEYSETFPNGVLKTLGNYRGGTKDGTWTGWHPDGQIHYKEEFNGGIMIRGRSQNSAGERFIYDGLSLFPQPEGGMEKLKVYLQDQVSKSSSKHRGTVRCSFRVTAQGVISDFEFEESPDPELNRMVQQFVLDGPDWLPAKQHGYQPVDGYNRVEVNF